MDLGVSTITNRIDVGSDHESFDSVGLPGFEFLQDELDYETRTHHSNLDTVDHLHKADLEQAAIVEAIFLWNTSQREAMMPRKPFPHPEQEKNKSAPIPNLFPIRNGQPTIAATTGYDDSLPMAASGSMRLGFLPAS